MNLAKASVRQAAVVGCTLNKIKRTIGHGKWEPWVRDRLKVSPDTALRYITPARKWKEIKPLLDANPMLSLSKVLGMVKAEGKAKPAQPMTKELDQCTPKELISAMRGDICHHLYDELKAR